MEDTITDEQKENYLVDFYQNPANVKKWRRKDGETIHIYLKFQKQINIQEKLINKVRDEYKQNKKAIKKENKKNDLLVPLTKDQKKI